MINPSNAAALAITLANLARNRSANLKDVTVNDLIIIEELINDAIANQLSDHPEVTE